MSASSRRSSSVQPLRLRQLPEHVLVVVSEKVGVVVLARQRDAERRQHLLVRAEVQRLGVRQHAVEVEHDRRGHFRRPPAWPIFSPALTGIARRFSRGG